MARIRGHEVQYSLFLEPGQAVFPEARMVVETEGAIRVEAILGGGAFVTNEGECHAEVEIVRAGQEHRLELDVGQIVRIEP